MLAPLPLTNSRLPCHSQTVVRKNVRGTYWSSIEEGRLLHAVQLYGESGEKECMRSFPKTFFHFSDGTFGRLRTDRPICGYQISDSGSNSPEETCGRISSHHGTFSSSANRGIIWVDRYGYGIKYAQGNVCGRMESGEKYT